MSRRIQVLSSIALVGTLGFSLAGCSFESSTPAPAATSSSLNGLPATFAGSTATVTGLTRYALGAHGWAAVSLKSGKTRLTYFDVDGRALWAGSLSAIPSALYVVSDSGHDWIVARLGDAVAIFDSQAQGQSVHPLHRVDVGTATISASPTRLLITGGKAALLNPSEGTLTAINLPADVSAVAAVGDGVLMTRHGMLIGLGSDRGGWTARSVRPANVANDARPALLGVSAGVAAIAWGDVVTVNRLTDGSLIAEGQIAIQRKMKFLVASDSSVVVLGNQVLAAGSMSAATLPDDFTPAAAFEGVVYGSDDTGAVALDATTLKPIATKAPQSAPAAVATWRSAFFASPSSENGTFSVTIAPLRALDQGR